MVPEANAELVAGTLSSKRDDRALVTAETATRYAKKAIFAESARFYREPGSR